MACYRHAGSIQVLAVFLVGEDCVGEVLGYVGLHFVVGGEGRGGGVDVEARGHTKVPGVVLAGEVEPARGGVRVEDCEAAFGGGGLEEALFGAVLGGAGQAREVD